MMVPPSENSRRVPERGGGLSALILGVGACVASPVRAGEEADVSRAQELFDQARALLHSNRIPEACALFAESQALDPGGGTLLNLGICRYREGRTATAHRLLTQALDQARSEGRANRVATAERHLSVLATLLSRLTVRLDPSADGVVVELDGERLPQERFGEAMPLDPGTHEIRATAPDHEPWSTTVTLGRIADHIAVEIPRLTALGRTATAGQVASTTKKQAAIERRPVSLAAPFEPPRQSASSLMWLGYGLTGVGALATGFGAYFGARAVHLRGKSDRYFQDGYCLPESSCVKDWNDAKRAAHLSTGGLSLGAVSVGFGLYLLLQPRPGPSAPRVSVLATPSRGIVTAEGVF